MAKRKVLIDRPTWIREVLELRGLGSLVDVYREIREIFRELKVTHLEVDQGEPKQESLFSDDDDTGGEQQGLRPVRRRRVR